VGKDTLVTRHEFLKKLHEMLQPKFYLEIGVQHGWSLQLSQAELSIGVDPNPLITTAALQRTVQNEVFIAQQTSDDFFETYIKPDTNFGPIDFAFIDGMHLVEYALRDFANIERYSHDRSVIVFDDVLPTTVEMAARAQCPGDWTGDVWRVYDILRERRPDLVLLLVDTQPTGVLVVLRPDPIMGPKIMDACLLYDYEFNHNRVPRTYFEIDLHDAVLDRRHALPADVVLAEVARRLT
jgi:predicted O-methyltransferase YrrM